MRVGIHLPNDGKIAEHRWRVLSRYNLLKTLVRLDADDPLDYALLAERAHPSARFILRLYWPGYLPPDKVLSLTDDKLPPILETLGEARCLIEIGNEPNHADGIEGFGRSAKHAREYGAWYEEVLSGLRAADFRNLGFPGLAVAEHAHSERTWGNILIDLMYASDWVGCHCYWQTTDQLFDSALGQNWHWYVSNVPRPIYVTEAGNSACHSEYIQNPAQEQQAQQYARFAQNAHQGGVVGAVFFMLDGSSDWAGFRLSDQALNKIAGLNLPYS